MSMKKTDLAKSLAKKITGRMNSATPPDRFGPGAVVDKREQRRLDSEAGLVSFACKLPSTLAEQLRERAATHEGGVNALVAELLAVGLSGQP